MSVVCRSLCTATRASFGIEAGRGYDMRPGLCRRCLEGMASIHREKACYHYSLSGMAGECMPSSLPETPIIVSRAGVIQVSGVSLVYHQATNVGKDDIYGVNLI